MKEPKYYFTNVINDRINSVSKMFFGENEDECIYKMGAKGIAIIISIFGIALSLILALIIYLLGAKWKDMDMVACLMIIQVVVVSSIYPLASGDALRSGRRRLFVVVAILANSFLSACIMGVASDIILKEHFACVSQVIYYIWSALVIAFQYRVVYEYSYQIYNNADQFNNIVESILFILTILLALPSNNERTLYPFIVPVAICCLYMIYTKIINNSIYNKKQD